MAGTTTAKKPTPSPTPTPTPTATPTPTPVPTPTPNSDNRVVYFGDAATEPDGDGQLVVTPVTTGGAYQFAVTATNNGNQNLTHAQLGFGDAATAWADAPGGAPSLPGIGNGAEILFVEVAGATCPAVSPGATGYLCDVGSLASGASVTATFTVQAPSVAMDTAVWASFKVAENVPDQGANRNTFFAASALNIDPTSSNASSTYVTAGNPLHGSTNQPLIVPGDIQSTTVRLVEDDGQGGVVSLVEKNIPPTACVPLCIGQEVSTNVRGGQQFELPQYLEWTVVIARSDVPASKIVVHHVLDGGEEVLIPNTKAFSCDSLGTDCMESVVVNKGAGVTTVIFRTSSNGVIRI
jgi:hypothetical protein